MFPPVCFHDFYLYDTLQDILCQQLFEIFLENLIL
nr:MAG TPA: hypothetical protein [Caudoviricetes sp.]